MTIELFGVIREGFIDKINLWGAAIVFEVVGEADIHLFIWQVSAKAVD